MHLLQDVIKARAGPGAGAPGLLQRSPCKLASIKTSGLVTNDKENEYGYIGRLGNNYVLAKFSEDNKKMELSLRDSSNAVISNAFIEMKYVGAPFCGDLGCMPSEHRKVRNNKLYLLNRDKNMAVISVIDLADIFHVK